MFNPFSFIIAEARQEFKRHEKYLAKHWPGFTFRAKCLHYALCLWHGIAALKLRRHGLRETTPVMEPGGGPYYREYEKLPVSPLAQWGL